MNTIPEIALVKLLVSYTNFQEYHRYVNRIYLKNNYPELARVYDALVKFMTGHARDTSVAELHTYFLAQHPEMDDKQRGVYDAIFQQIAESGLADSGLDLVKSVRRREALQALAVKAFETAEGRSSLEELAQASKLVLESQGQPESSLTPVNFVSDDLNSLLDEAVKTPGLRWRLPSLNQSLGSLRKGDFGFIFARPETGKTTFLASEITYMASQLGGDGLSPILWFNNEEQGSKVMLRCYQAALGLRLEQLLSSIAKHREEFTKLTKGNIKIYDQAIISKEDVERICGQFAPSLIIFDQIDKISGFKADRNDLELGDIYNWARELAKRYCPVIGVCQADGTGEGVKWLTMANVANAKTSKQAEADWILGIGRSNDEGYEGVRHFHISKNKLIGDKDSLPEMRHGKWDVKLDPGIARYEDFLSE